MCGREKAEQGKQWDFCRAGIGICKERQPGRDGWLHIKQKTGHVSFSFHSKWLLTSSPDQDCLLMGE